MVRFQKRISFLLLNKRGNKNSYRAAAGGGGWRQADVGSTNTGEALTHETHETESSGRVVKTEPGFSGEVGDCRMEIRCALLCSSGK